MNVNLKAGRFSEIFRQTHYSSTAKPKTKEPRTPQLIGIVTDSNCELSSDHLARLGAVALPMTVILGGQPLQDGSEITADEVFEFLEEHPDAPLPTTEAPTVEAFMKVYSDSLKEFDSVLSLHVSSDFSSTIDHAREAARRLDATDRIHILDSRVATAFLGELVLYATQINTWGGTILDMTTALSAMRDSMVSRMTVRDLQYLKSSKLAHSSVTWLSDWLNIRPILSFQDGKVVPTGRAFEDTAMKSMVHDLERHFTDAPVSVIIASVSDDGSLEQMERAIKKSRLNVGTIREYNIGAAVATQTGPSAYGMGAYPLEYGMGLSTNTLPEDQFSSLTDSVNLQTASTSSLLALLNTPLWQSKRNLEKS
jgi:DegV family protein with EDD domain